MTPDDDALRNAFLAFFPAYEMAHLRHAALDDPANPRRGRINRFRHLRRLLDHRARKVTTPNNDTLYSSAWLDLRAGPLLVQTPAMPQRYHALQFINMHTDNLAVLGRRVGGDGPLRVAVVGPGWQGPVPAHSHRVDADTDDLWLLVRILIDGPHDLPAVAALQDAMQIVAPPVAPLPPRLAPPRTPDPEAFLAVVGELLRHNPARGAMAAKAAAAAALGIGGGSPWPDLPATLRAAWQARWPALLAELRDPATLRERRHQGWDVPPPEMGRATQDDLLRATIALRGIAALDADEALYLGTFTDSAGRPLDGAHRYHVHLPPGGVPVDGFWSLALYEVLPDGRFFFTDNPIGRYAIGNRTQGLQLEHDGSATLLVQHAAPDAAANWLPAPPGPFRLTLRAYLPQPALVRGEAPLPRVERQ